MNEQELHYRIIKFDELSSTNGYACEMINRNEAVEGMVITCQNQTQGKGMGSNTWESEAGANLTFSLILQPVFLDPARQFLLNQVASLSVARFIEDITDERVAVSIKWPNDVYSGDSKIAGILIQNMLQGKQIRYSVVGIGININQEIFRSDAPNPVSLKMITGRHYEPDRCLGKVLEYLAEEYCIVRKGALDKTEKDYLSRLYRYESWCGFESEGKKFRGMITGVSPYGHLIIRDEFSKDRQFGFKEVVYL